jgi:exonuclease VII small subunit
MWKKQDDAVGAQPEFASEQVPEFSLESAGEAMIEAYRNRHEKGKMVGDMQKFVAEGRHQPSPPATMATYTEAVNEFTKNATAFIEQLPLLAKARDAYERAMRASAELRKVLDAGEENLRTLMTQLEHGDVHVVKPALDKKKPEVVKVEAIRGTDESTGGVKAFT